MTIGVSARWLCFVGVAVSSMGCSASHGTVADASVDASSACRRHTECLGDDVVEATCTDGVCAIVACVEGHADCNERAADGCEADLASVRSCGACDVTCDRNELCVGRRCETLPRQLALSHGFALVLDTATGEVWGIGDDLEAYVLTPDASGLTRWQRVHELEPGSSLGTGGGGSHVCTVSPSDRRARCWGANASLQLGVETEELTSFAPQRVELGEQVTWITRATFSTCASTESGSVYCWGSNEVGQLGLPHDVLFSLPVVMPLPEVRALFGEGLTHCAQTRDAGLWCWGLAIYGGSRDAGVAPAPLRGIPDEVTSMILRDETTCAVDRAGNLTCFGRLTPNLTGVEGEEEYRPPTRIDPGFEAPIIAIGKCGGYCALHDDGRTVCWGERDLIGPLIDPTGSRPERILPPMVVEGLPPLASLFSDDDLCCGTTPEGELWCWGSDPTRVLGELAPAGTFVGRFFPP